MIDFMRPPLTDSGAIFQSARPQKNRTGPIRGNDHGIQYRQTGRYTIRAQVS